jgi:6-phosphofructokinase 1
MNRATIQRLGEPQHSSAATFTVSDDLLVPSTIQWANETPPDDLIWFESAGPRKRLYFEPSAARAAIVTCGGLCPGLNNVIRSLTRELVRGYGVRSVVGIRDGYRGLDPQRGKPPVELTEAFVEDIHKDGGTALGTSRGPVDMGIAVDFLIDRQINILFTVGGDGTQRGGYELYREAQRRGHPLSVVGIPKTVDNDVAFVARSFGYLTAVQEAAAVLHRAHTEARSVENGIAVVKLMGRHAGFIAAGATVASQDVNFCLIPEVPFALEGQNGLLEALRARILKKAHAVVVIAEGAGQEFLRGADGERDASGNVRLQDIGSFLRGRIETYFESVKIPVVMRYIDPSYIIRSSPANSEDSILCDLFARNAAHAAMAGKTGLVIGYLHDKFIHVPIELLTSRKKQVEPEGFIWSAILSATGQPKQFA